MLFVRIDESERDLIDFFDVCYAARVFASEYAGNGFREREVQLFHGNAIAYICNGDAGVNEPKNIEVELKVGFNLYEVFFAHLFAVYVTHENDYIVQLIKSELLENLVAMSLSDMVENNAFFQL